MYELIQKSYNCIVVFDQDKNHVLFCKRVKDPFQGLYNFVGGKIEPGENGYDAAYRELEEETGIARQDIAHLINVAMKYPLADISFL